MSNFVNRTLSLPSPGSPIGSAYWTAWQGIERKAFLKIYAKLKGASGLSGVAELTIGGVDNPYSLTVTGAAESTDFRVVSVNPSDWDYLQLGIQLVSGSLSAGSVDAEVYVECDDLHTFRRDVGDHELAYQLLDIG